MNKLVDAIKTFKKGEVGRRVASRIRQFENAGRTSGDEIFGELCFCILTANFNAERAIKIQKRVGDSFISLPEKKLAEKLKNLGYRYPNTRAKYIVDARRYKSTLKKVLGSLRGDELRDWFVKNIRGLGYKEASHFLRNIGYKDYAIIDFHIIDLLARYGLIKKPNTITKERYLGIEEILRELGRRLNLSLAELDLYLWYMETGKVLK